MSKKKKTVLTKRARDFLSQGRTIYDGSIAYVLRTCDANMTAAHRGFVWPRSGAVTCDDWAATRECGNGLHGFLWGTGDHALASYAPGAIWVVCAVWSDDVVDLGGKVKFPRAWVVFAGQRDDAVALLVYLGGKPDFRGTATAGDAGTATAGYAGTATAGDDGTATAGDDGTATAGYAGTATAGYAGTATAGDDGTATAGYAGTATAGARGTATAGYAGTATAGYAGTATAGARGVISIWGWDGKRRRMVTGYVGEDGIKANVAYRVDPKTGCLVEAR